MRMYEAAKQILAEARKPLHVREIYQQIVERGLFTFGAKSPTSVLSQTLSERCSEGRKGKEPMFEKTAPGTYKLAD